MLLATWPYQQPSMLVYVANAPTVGTVSSPKIDFISFATDLLSTLGFWLGMDMINTFDFFWNNTIQRALNKRAEKRAAKKNRKTSAHVPRSVSQMDKDMRHIERKLKQVTDYLYDSRLVREAGLLVDIAQLPEEQLFKTDIWATPGSGSRLTTYVRKKSSAK